MIPLAYRLRDAVRLEATADGSWRAVCSLPLTVLDINAAAARLLERTRGGATVGELAATVAGGEERVLQLCEYFRGRGILEVGPAPDEPGFAPSVSVIIPTRDRADSLDECLRALEAVDYPRDRVEVIVVDDGSADPASVAATVERRGHRLLVNTRNHGQSFARNRAAREAVGEVLAFIDSDCVADPGWLRELVPYFSWDRVGAVGGRVASYHGSSRLDRYEEVASPLDMGRHLRLAAAGPGTFYVPTCDLLVRRSTYRSLGGLREDLHVGEDVDFCWRLRAAGSYLVYAAEGTVRHKHRSRLGALLRRRADYGTSEAILHRLHPEKRKRFPLSPAPLATVAVLAAALVALEPRLLPLCLAPPLWDGVRRTIHLRRTGVRIPSRSVWLAVARGHLSMPYFVLFHLVRYYLAILLIAGLVAHGAWVLAACAILYTAAVDYVTRRPRLGYPTYLGLFVAEHVAYQAGVVVGCVRSRTFRSYLPSIHRDRSWELGATRG